eukprot:3725336-Pyramimonas_sp.AAC.2
MCLVIFVEELTLLLESTSPLLSSAYRDDVATSARSCVRDMTAIWLADGVDSGACMYPLRPHPPDGMRFLHLRSDRRYPLPMSCSHDEGRINGGNKPRPRPSRLIRLCYD